MIRRLSRRAFLSRVAALATIAVVRRSVFAQQPSSRPHIGVLQGGWWTEEMVQAFRQGLLDAGYSEGRNVVIEWRSADGDYDRLPELAADLVQRKVDVILAATTPASQAAKRATSTIPIVMVLVGDPVASGLVANLARPDGNVTGFSLMVTDLSAKRLELLKEALPRVTRVAVLWNPDSLYHPKVIENLKAAAPALSIALNFVSARTPSEFEAAFSVIGRARGQALFVAEDPLFFAHQTTLLKLATKARLPLIYGEKHFGLMSYGASWNDLFRRSAGYVVRILKGVKPGDLPIEQPTKFELVVNLKNAKALGITIPESILSRADEVIQ